MGSSFGQIFWSRTMLNEFRDNFFIGEHVGHAEIFYFYEKSTGEISRPRNFIDKHERHSKVSRFQRCASGSNNSNKRALHDFGGMISFDFESATPASELSILWFQTSLLPPFSPRRGERIKVRGCGILIENFPHLTL